MSTWIWPIAVLLFGSGVCSLVYETVWLRELGLVFGGSTMASGAVVACFVGGLGAGAILGGRRADRHSRPLLLYSQVEAVVAASAAISPLLLRCVRVAYVASGGTRVLGSVGGAAMRLVLAAAVFAIPTFSMGVTLPAVATAVERTEDGPRRVVAVLYGANTLGAVTGCVLSTFFLLETFGTRRTLWIACCVNAVVSIVAVGVARVAPPPRSARHDARARRPPAKAWLPLVAAGITGFVFCLMELVWYRMLGPLLGGSVFTFGLILALALLGVGLGGTAYGTWAASRPATVAAFAWSCLLEAACLGIPLALGDRLAVLAALLRPIGGLFFALHVASWVVLAGAVVTPAAFVAGVQFAILIGLLGRGNEDVGRDVGLIYGANTLGAIAGSLAGGFGLIPLLTAPGCWRLSVWLLLAVGAGATALHARRRPTAAFGPVVAGALAIACVCFPGPTEAWRHSPIGAGRVDPQVLRTPNGVRDWVHLRRRVVGWQAEGRESSVAIDYETGLAFYVNGKDDGNARSDAGTTVMLGLLGAMLHPRPTRAMVIGLGTGETAGWLAAIDTVTNVDVAELEPAVLEVARRADVVNAHALANPKVHIEIGDARELLLTSKQTYDLVASEPSNPYRAGVASLFTREYYEAVAAHLDTDGLFTQWLQGYDVDPRTVQTVYATLAAVFPEVETWELSSGDMVLVAGKKEIRHDLAQVRARMTEEPYKRAVGLSWRATDVESFFSHFVATSGFARRIARQEADGINTDDRNIVEFGFARSVGTGRVLFSVDDVRRAARAVGESRPSLTGGTVDWDRVDDGVIDAYLGDGAQPTYPNVASSERGHRLAALRAADEGHALRAIGEWRAQSRSPEGPTEMAMIASATAELGDDSALSYAEWLRAFSPGEADAIVARLRLRQGRFEESTLALEALFGGLRSDPWPMFRLVTSALAEVKELVARDPRASSRLYAALRSPFALGLADEARKQAALAAALRMPGGACVEAVTAFEPSVPWNEDFLRTRYECYRAFQDARASRADEDLRDWRAHRMMTFAASLDGP